MNKTYNQHKQTIQDLYEDQNQRRNVSKEIAWNLYRKHFHNFFTPREYLEAFPWLSGTLAIGKEGPTANGTPIPEVYLSKDVWRIAHHLRKDAYRAFRSRVEDNLKQVSATLEELDRESKGLTRRRERALHEKRAYSRSLQNLR